MKMSISRRKFLGILASAFAWLVVPAAFAQRDGSGKRGRQERPTTEKRGRRLCASTGSCGVRAIVSRAWAVSATGRLP